MRLRAIFLLAMMFGNCAAFDKTASSKDDAMKTRKLFFAEGGQNCNEACYMVVAGGAIKRECYLEPLKEAAKDQAACKSAIENMNLDKAFPGDAAGPGHMGIQSVGTHADDNSGCTYYPSHGLVQLMRKPDAAGNGGDPTCEQRNPDKNRRRVCACRVKVTGKFYSYYI